MCFCYLLCRLGEIKKKKNQLVFVALTNLSSVLCREFVTERFRAVRSLVLSEHVGTSVRMSGCSDRELENFAPLARSSHPWDCDVFDTMRHSDQNTPPLQHKVRSRVFFLLPFCVHCCWWRQIILVRPQGVCWWAQSDMTGPNRIRPASAKCVLFRWQNQQ